VSIQLVDEAVPGWCYSGPDPDGYLSSAELAGHLERYAASFESPVITDTAVLQIEEANGHGCVRFRVVTNHGIWHARHAVVATGPYSRPHLPGGLRGVSHRVEVLTANSYRNPAALGPGGCVLVVGASASGMQIADELIRAGREVVLAVGRLARMPRRYRGMDSFWWLEETGRLARTINEVPNIAAARRETSPRAYLWRRLRSREPDVPRMRCSRSGRMLLDRPFLIDCS
jgi:putative flavoprotein involved in K+ transport